MPRRVLRFTMAAEWARDQAQTKVEQAGAKAEVHVVLGTNSGHITILAHEQEALDKAANAVLNDFVIGGLFRQ